MEAILLHVLGEQHSCLCSELPCVLGTAAQTLQDLDYKPGMLADSNTAQGKGDELSQPTGPWGFPDLQLHVVSSCPLQRCQWVPCEGFLSRSHRLYNIKTVPNKA